MSVVPSHRRVFICCYSGLFFPHRGRSLNISLWWMAAVVSSPLWGSHLSSPLSLLIPWRRRAREPTHAWTCRDALVQKVGMAAAYIKRLTSPGYASIRSDRCCLEMSHSRFRGTLNQLCVCVFDGLIYWRTNCGNRLCFSAWNLTVVHPLVKGRDRQQLWSQQSATDAEPRIRPQDTEEECVCFWSRGGLTGSSKRYDCLSEVGCRCRWGESSAEWAPSPFQPPLLQAQHTRWPKKDLHSSACS